MLEEQQASIKVWERCSSLSRINRSLGLLQRIVRLRQ